MSPGRRSHSRFSTPQLPSLPAQSPQAPSISSVLGAPSSPLVHCWCISGPFDSSRPASLMGGLPSCTFVSKVPCSYPNGCTSANSKTPSPCPSHCSIQLAAQYQSQPRSIHVYPVGNAQHLNTSTLTCMLPCTWHQGGIPLPLPHQTHISESSNPSAPRCKPVRQPGRQAGPTAILLSHLYASLHLPSRSLATAPLMQYTSKSAKPPNRPGVSFSMPLVPTPLW